MQIVSIKQKATIHIQNFSFEPQEARKGKSLLHFIILSFKLVCMPVRKRISLNF